MPADVVVYTTNYCPYCFRAKGVLGKKGTPFTEIDVTFDPTKRAWLAKTTGRTSVPQIFINGKAIGGCDDLMALDRKGELDALLAQSPASAS